LTGFDSTPTAVVRLHGITVDCVNVVWHCGAASSLCERITGQSFRWPAAPKENNSPMRVLLVPGAGICPQHGGQGLFRRDVAKGLVELGRSAFNQGDDSKSHFPLLEGRVSLKPPMLRSEGLLSTFFLRCMHHHGVRTSAVAALKVAEVGYAVNLDQQFALSQSVGLVVLSSKRGSDTWVS
jgi:hypothetical protein